MSKAVSVLNGAQFSGLAKVEDAGLQGMITLRGDLESSVLKAAVKAATGAEVPARGAITVAENGAAAWMSPDELLLLVEYERVDAVVAKLGEDLVEAEMAVSADSRLVGRTLQTAGIEGVVPSYPGKPRSGSGTASSEEVSMTSSPSPPSTLSAPSPPSMVSLS